MKKLPETFVIFDTEYTSWEGSLERDWSNEDEHREIIQIGAIRVANLKEVDSFLVYVKPTLNPELSNFIIELTGIDQETIDAKGVSYEEAEKAFLEWRDGLPAYSFKGADQLVMMENDDLNGLKRIEDTNYFSVAEIFEAHGIDTTTYMSSTIPEAFGLTPPPHAHDAVNDARSILLAFQALFKRET